MRKMNIGKIRGLGELTDKEGFLTVLALDQRSSLVKALNLEKDAADLYAQVRDFKMQTTEALLPYCSAVLLDPQYGAAEAMVNGLIRQKGLIVTIEETGYIDNPDGRINQVITGWSLEKAKRMGASAAKLLVYYNPRNPSVSETQREFVRCLSDLADDLDLPLLLEPMSYSIDPQIPKKSQAFAELRPDIVLETVHDFGEFGVDVLKLEFPVDVSFETDKNVWQKACERITESAPVPWVLLSAGVDFPVFRDQLEVACKAGASGFVAGRAIWKEAASLKGQERIHFLQTTAADRAKELVDIVHAFSTLPWRKKMADYFAPVEENWMLNYKDF